jgi:hypothetical protein
MFSASKSGQYQGYQISRSVRLRSSASAYFNRTLTTPTNNRIFTWSGWVKIGAIPSSREGIFVAVNAPGNTFFGLEFNPSAGLTLYDSNSSPTSALVTTQVFRDPSSWYHIVLGVDTTQATASNRYKLYVNGSQITSFSTTAYAAQNSTPYMNSAVAHSIGSWQPSVGLYFDGYMTEINFIDGQALTPSSFGAYNAYGVWSPLKYNGTYGTNGFYLNFSDNSGATATTIGKDSSGNGNNWTPNNISVTAGVTYDSMLDVPTQWGDGGNNRGNYAIFNPLDKGGDFTLSNANLTFTGSASASGWRACRASIGITSGKWRYSIYGTVGTSARVNFGIGKSTTDVSSYFSSQNIGIQYAPYDALIYVDGTSSTFPSGGTTYRSTYTFDVLIDADNKKIWFAVDGTVLNSGNPDTGANPAATWTHTDPIFPIAQVYGGTWSADFGQQPFTNTISTATNFKALNTFNLPQPTIPKGNLYMDATLYTANASSQTISSLQFQPDFLWIKSRSGAYSNILQNSVTGPTYELFSNLTNAEFNSADRVLSFTSNGWTMGADAAYGVNAPNGSTQVAWSWKASGTTVTNTSGSITSTVSVNPTAGFSVVTMTYSSVAGTVGHGLGVAPQMIIVKRRDSTGDWYVAHTGLTNMSGYYIVLNTTAAQGAASWGGSPTSTVFYMSNSIFASGNYVAYCFAPVAGFSKFGSYTGNGSADGTFVFTGFRPRYVMVKRTDSAVSWIVIDTARNPYNVSNYSLLPNSSAAEVTSSTETDILSNGFKLRTTDVSLNASGGTYIYAVFAENPFKYSLAR